MLDNNGYVVVSQELAHTGQFFGEVRGRIMERLVAEQIYQPINITDYQAVCFDDKNRNSPGNVLRTPFVYAGAVLRWAMRWLTWSAFRMAALSATWWPEAEAFSQYEEYEDNGGGGEDDGVATHDPTAMGGKAFNDDPGYSSGPVDEKTRSERVAKINRTRLQPCDQEVTLYALYPQNYKQHNAKSVYRIPAHDCERCDAWFRRLIDLLM